ncbi:MAG: polymer-forming cytoskeletal protein [Deltaproteobacteria bacterium]|nr:polymer-forming cytoskeletal protein [Deltaproteobacteria bacterium]
MFSKKSGDPTIIGNGTVIEGKIIVNNGIQIDGRVIGNVESNENVSIGPQGIIEGELIGVDIAIGGRVEGKVTARGHLHMVSSGAVIGDVFYKSIEVDRGAVIAGRTEHLDNMASEPNLSKSRDRSDDDVEINSVEPLKVVG